MGERSANSLARRGTIVLVAAALAAAVALLAACGGSNGSSSGTRAHVQVTQLASDRWVYARARFREMCSGCHTLRDAGTHGRRFNLDRAGGVERNLARHAIEDGEPGMPAWNDVLSLREREELIDYVSSVARHDTGETGWEWQIRLREEGGNWRPPGGGAIPK